MISILLTLLISISASASKTHLIYAGGGGESATKANQFTRGAILLGQKNSLFQSQSIIYDGNHPDDKKKLAEAFNTKEVSDFTTKTFRSQLQAYRTQVAKGQIQKGEQILVYIDTHGSEALEDGSHEVSTNDDNMNLHKEVEKFKKEMKAAGVRLAIVDGSCHSGASQSLADDNTCVISSADTNIGYTDFGWALPEALQKGRSLEDAFLKARSSMESASNPQISTPEHALTLEETIKFTSRLAHNDTDVLRGPQCYPISNNMETLALAVSNIKNEYLDDNYWLSKGIHSLPIIGPSIQTAGLLSDSIAKLHKERNQLLLAHDQLMTQFKSDIDFLNRPEWSERRVNFEHEGKEVYYSYRAATQNFSKFIENIKLEIEGAPSNQQAQKLKKELQEVIFYKDVVEKEAAKEPDLARLLKIKNGLSGHKERLKESAEAIKVKEMELYDSVYKSHQTDKSHPCRDFVI